MHIYRLILIHLSLSNWEIWHTVINNDNSIQKFSLPSNDKILKLNSNSMLETDLELEAILPVADSQLTLRLYVYCLRPYLNLLLVFMFSETIPRSL